jgi:3-deoxy-D-manno-octulosonic-acid transferase
VVEVSVGDTTGELRRLAQLADLVFVGKSLPPHTEGQTPVEAAALEKPILFGPGMSNFRLIARDLVARGAACEVPDAAALGSMTLELLRDARSREELAAAAGRWRHDNAGAVARTLAILREELAKAEG